MPRYFEWGLPSNPPIPYTTYLHSLAPMAPGDKKIYYTKYILGVIGELEVSTSKSPPPKVREWTFPKQLYTQPANTGANLIGLEKQAGSNSLWSLLQEYNGALVQLDPQTGLFTKYFVPPGRRYSPLLVPSALKFDGNGFLWFIGSSSDSHLSTICRFDPVRMVIRSWEIPQSAMLNVVSIYPNSSGSHVWISSVDSNKSASGHWIGRFDVASGNLTGYSPYPYLNPPRSIDIVLSDDPENTSVWFTAAPDLWQGVTQIAPAIYRFDVPSNTFHKHETDPQSSWPRFIGLDSAGVAWVTDIGRNSIARCHPQVSCGRIVFKSKTYQLDRRESKVAKDQYRVKPIYSTAVFHGQTATERKFPCAQEYAAPGMTNPDRIRTQDISPNRRPRLFVVCWGWNKIGLLEP